MPTRWAAYVEVGDEVAGPFWASEPVATPLTATPALVELPEGADARGFLDAQGLGWMHDLAAAEAAGMVIRIPLSASRSRPSRGYDRLVVIGAALGTGHDAALQDLFDAHRYTRGLELLPPGTPTNVTADSPDGVGTLDVGALFDAEFARAETAPKPPARGDRTLPPPPGPPPATAADLFSAAPAAAVTLAFGLPDDNAVQLAAAAADPEPELARAANAALWPATFGSWFTDPMSMDDAPLISTADIETLRAWFVDFVARGGPTAHPPGGTPSLRPAAGDRH